MPHSICEPRRNLWLKNDWSSCHNLHGEGRPRRNHWRLLWKKPSSYNPIPVVTCPQLHQLASCWSLHLSNTFCNILGIPVQPTKRFLESEGENATLLEPAPNTVAAHICKQNIKLISHIPIEVNKNFKWDHKTEAVS